MQYIKYGALNYYHHQFKQKAEVTMFRTYRTKGTLKQRLEHYEFCGLNADWICRAWKLGSKVYIYDEEDGEGTYTFCKVNIENRQLDKVLFSSCREGRLLKFLNYFESTRKTTMEYIDLGNGQIDGFTINAWIKNALKCDVKKLNCP
jgi:hypothetical protein